MNLLLLSDDEACERKIGDEPADVVLACGDIADAVIVRIAARVDASQILAVKGNHDSSGSFASPIVDLHLREHTIDGIRFGGFAGSWRYKPRGNYLFDQEEVTRLIANFPQVDVFIAHNSSRRIHDRDDNVHLGFDGFASYIERTKPKLFIHGHQHLNRQTQLGQTTIIGVYGFQRLTVSEPVR